MSRKGHKNMFLPNEPIFKTANPPQSNQMKTPPASHRKRQFDQSRLNRASNYGRVLPHSEGSVRPVIFEERLNGTIRWRRLNTNNKPEIFMKSKNVRMLLLLTIMSMIVVLNVPGQTLKSGPPPVQPTQPAPTQPVPTQPAPTQPVVPTQPVPTQPMPIGPEPQPTPTPPT